MTPTDQAAKKVKTADSGFTYAQDEYKITCDFLKNSRFEVLYMATRARAEIIRHLLEYVGVSIILCSFQLTVGIIGYCEEKKT